jgi:hypothetical protein
MSGLADETRWMDATGQATLVAGAEAHAVGQSLLVDVQPPYDGSPSPT